MVVTYSKALTNIHAILRKHLKILHQSNRLKKIFPDPPIVSFKRDNNIKDILVHKKHNIMFYKQTNICSPCGKNCVLCPHIIETDHFTDNNGNKYTIQGNINCKTVGVIYTMICTECKSFLDLYLEFDDSGQLSTKIYDKRDDFNFKIINFPNICSNIPASPAYGVYISQLIRYARASSNYSDFLKRHLHLRNRLLDQGYRKIRLIRSLKKFIFRYQDLVEIYSVPAETIISDAFSYSENV